MTKLYIVLGKNWDEDNEGNIVTLPSHIRELFKSREKVEIFVEDAKEKREWAIVEEHICPNAPEVIIRHVDDTFHFDLLRSMVADGGVKHADSVRIPLKFCPFCGERLIKENKKERGIKK